MQGDTPHSPNAPAPSLWPLGVALAISVAVIDVASKAFLGEIALDSPAGRRVLGGAMALVSEPENGSLGWLVTLAGELALALVTLVGLLRVRRSLTAVGLGFLLGGLLGKLLDRWDDGVTSDILQIGGALRLNVSDLALGAAAILLALALARRARPAAS